MARTIKRGKRARFSQVERKRNLRDTIATLEATRRSFQRQLAGEVETRFPESFIRLRIDELTASLEAHRQTLASL